MSDPLERLEIRGLKHKYCKYTDNKGYESWRHLFTEGGTFGRKGDEPFVGKETLQEFNQDVFDSSYRYSAHFLANPLIEVDGRNADGEWYLLLLYELTDGSTGWKHGSYTNTYRKVDDDWLIDSTIVSFRATREFGAFQVGE